MYNIFFNLLSRLAPNGDKNLIAGFINAMVKHATTFGITTPNRISHFVAQATHETEGFKTFTEGWDVNNPSKWQKLYWTKNGNTLPADGYKYRGRGVFQITGKGNYRAASLSMFKDERLVKNPELLATNAEYATLAALHYWNDRNMNAMADRNDTLKISTTINGRNKTTGLPNGWQQRKLYAASAFNFFSDVKMTASIMDDKKKRPDTLNLKYLIPNIIGIFTKRKK